MSNDERTRIRNYCLRLLKYRPRSQKEIEERLRRKKYPSDLIKKVVGELSEAGLINDREFVKFWVNWRKEVNPCSKHFISWELRRKGIPQALIEEGLSEISSEDDFSQAEAVAKKQFEKSKNIEPEKRRRRIYAYLQRRGFEQSIIWDVLNGLFAKSNIKN